MKFIQIVLLCVLSYTVAASVLPYCNRLRNRFCNGNDDPKCDLLENNLKCVHYSVNGGNVHDQSLAESELHNDRINGDGKENEGFNSHHYSHGRPGMEIFHHESFEVNSTYKKYLKIRNLFKTRITGPKTTDKTIN